MTSLIIGIVLIVGGIAFAAAPFFRRSDDDAAPETLTPADRARDVDAASTRQLATEALHTADGTFASELEELELDRAMGKLSEDDYRTLRASLDARARTARRGGGASAEAPPPAPAPPTSDDTTPARQLPRDASPPASSSPHDASPGASVAGAPDDVDAEIERRVRSARSLRVVCAGCGPRPEPGARFCSNCGAVMGGCPACGHAQLPPGARFCDRCGTGLVP